MFCHPVLICFSLSRLPVSAGWVAGGVAGQIFPRWQLRHLKCFFSFLRIAIYIFLYWYMVVSQTTNINSCPPLRELFIINWININGDKYNKYIINVNPAVVLKIIQSPLEMFPRCHSAATCWNQSIYQLVNQLPKTPVKHDSGSAKRWGCFSATGTAEPLVTEEKINRAKYADAFTVYKLIPCLFLCMESLEKELMHLKGLIQKFQSTLTECSIRAPDETSLCCQIFSLANSLKHPALTLQSLHQ